MELVVLERPGDLASVQEQVEAQLCSGLPPLPPTVLFARQLDIAFTRLLEGPTLSFEELAERECIDARPLDIVVVLEAAAESRGGLESRLEALVQLLYVLPLQFVSALSQPRPWTSKDWLGLKPEVRIGILAFAERPRLVVPLSGGRSRDELVDAVVQLRFSHPHFVLPLTDGVRGS